ncbi:hypothetical protein ABZP36_024234 [Zizania latifolia]
MGLSEEQQRKALEIKHMTNGVTEDGASAQESPEEIGTDVSAVYPAAAGGCCQGNGGFTCCQNDLSMEKQERSDQKSSEKETDKECGGGNKKGHTKMCSMPTWFETWERADTYATLAVVAAAASVFVAFRMYKNLS